MTPEQCEVKKSKYCVALAGKANIRLIMFCSSHVKSPVDVENGLVV